MIKFFRVCQRTNLGLTSVDETTKSLGYLALKGQINSALSHSTPYLHLLGHTVVAWMWLLQANEATKLLSAQKIEGSDNFLKGKIKTAQFYFAWEVPKIKMWAEAIRSGDQSALEMSTDLF